MGALQGTLKEGEKSKDQKPFTMTKGKDFSFEPLKYEPRRYNLIERNGIYLDLRLATEGVAFLYVRDSNDDTLKEELKGLECFQLIPYMIDSDEYDLEKKTFGYGRYQIHDKYSYIIKLDGIEILRLVKNDKHNVRFSSQYIAE